MTTLAVCNNAALTSQSGLAVSALATIAVRRESDGVLASIFSDRDGLVPISQPGFAADAFGRFAFYAAGLLGGYRITVTDAASPGLSYTLRNVAIGTAAQLDVESFVLEGDVFNQTKGADIASASTIDLDAATGNLIDVTGTTTINAITLSAGRERVVRFTGALTLTHGASLVLLGGASIVTAAGDFAVFRGYASSVVRLESYARAASAPLSYATQAQQETGTSAVAAVTPATQQFHPSAPKAWVQYDSAGGRTSSYNVTSVTDNGTGNLSPVWGTDFSSTAYAMVCSAEAAHSATGSTSFAAQALPVGRLAGSHNIATYRQSDFAQTDVTYMNVVALGDQ